MPSQTYKKLGQVILNSSGAIDITGIPNTYTTLIIEAYLKGTNAADVTNCWYYFNNDTGSTSYNDFRGVGYGVNGVNPNTWLNNQSANEPYLYVGAIQGSSSVITGSYTPVYIVLDNYTSATAFKNHLTFYGTYSYESAWRSGNWKNSTDAINRITFGCGSTTFAAGSSVTVYGIKAA